MFNSSASARASVNSKATIKCKFCKSQCVEIDPTNSWPTFVCFNCGGQAHIIIEEKDYEIDDCVSHSVDIVKEVVWSKAKLSGAK